MNLIKSVSFIAIFVATNIVLGSEKKNNRDFLTSSNARHEVIRKKREERNSIAQGKRNFWNRYVQSDVEQCFIQAQQTCNFIAALQRVCDIKKDLASIPDKSFLILSDNCESSPASSMSTQPGRTGTEENLFIDSGKVASEDCSNLSAQNDIEMDYGLSPFNQREHLAGRGNALKEKKYSVNRTQALDFGYTVDQSERKNRIGNDEHFDLTVLEVLSQETENSAHRGFHPDEELNKDYSYQDPVAAQPEVMENNPFCNPHEVISNNNSSVRNKDFYENDFSKLHSSLATQFYKENFNQN